MHEEHGPCFGEHVPGGGGEGASVDEGDEGMGFGGGEAAGLDEEGFGAVLEAEDFCGGVVVGGGEVVGEGGVSFDYAPLYLGQCQIGLCIKQGIQRSHIHALKSQSKDGSRIRHFTVLYEQSLFEFSQQRVRALTPIYSSIQFRERQHLYLRSGNICDVDSVLSEEFG